MNILFCGDRNIKEGILISCLSICKASDRPINVYILTAGINLNDKYIYPIEKEFEKSLDELLKRYNPRNSAKLFDITDIFNSFLPAANMDTRFTPCCMLRLYADMVDELPEKILYLDNDVICRKDIDALYDFDMRGYEVAGVPDYYGRWFFKKNIFKFDYLNSGVLLLNLDEIKKGGLFKKCRNLCRDKWMFMPDQSAINKLSVSKAILPRRFNEQRKLKVNTALQHFTTSFRFFPVIRTVSVKPWQIDRLHKILKLNEYDDILNEYLKLKEQIL